LKINKHLLVFGAFRNTGTVALQIGKKTEVKVIAVSKNE
jgi:NADPH:quinone reductase-like Zn-dependent oxidoreductase